MAMWRRQENGADAGVWWKVFPMGAYSSKSLMKVCVLWGDMKAGHFPAHSVSLEQMVLSHISDYISKVC